MWIKSSISIDNDGHSILRRTDINWVEDEIGWIPRGRDRSSHVLIFMPVISGQMRYDHATKELTFEDSSTTHWSNGTSDRRITKVRFKPDNEELLKREWMPTEDKPQLGVNGDVEVHTVEHHSADRLG